MQRFSIRYLIIGIAMLAASGLAMAIKPSVKLADLHEAVDLETIIPKHFGEWAMDERAVPLVSPDVQAALNKVYAQTLSRTYINARGGAVMLSIAYGKDQSDSLSIHLPEGCYRGQGFAVQEKMLGFMNTAFGHVPVARLIATRDDRVEPITYWITIGEYAVDDGWEMKKAKLAYAFKGVVPDGLLVRVSSLSPDAASGYKLQESFTADLLSSLSPKQRMRLIGDGT